MHLWNFSRAGVVFFKSTDAVFALLSCHDTKEVYSPIVWVLVVQDVTFSLPLVQGVAVLEEGHHAAT